MIPNPKITDFGTAICTNSHERDSITLSQNMEIIVIFSFLYIIVLNAVGKCPKSYNSEHYSLIMGNKDLYVIIMTNSIRGLINRDSST